MANTLKVSSTSIFREEDCLHIIGEKSRKVTERQKLVLEAVLVRRVGIKKISGQG